MLALDKQNALNFQLLGGVWILQTLPAIVFGLFTRWFHRWALLAGWAAGMIYGTVVAYGFCTAVHARGRSRTRWPSCRASASAGYIGLTALAINIVVAIVLTAIFRARQAQQRHRHHRPVRLLRRHRRSGVQPVVAEELPIHP